MRPAICSIDKGLLKVKNREILRSRTPEFENSALAIDPGFLRFAFRASLASDGRGAVVFPSPSLGIV